MQKVISKGKFYENSILNNAIVKSVVFNFFSVFLLTSYFWFLFRLVFIIIYNDFRSN